MGPRHHTLSTAKDDCFDDAAGGLHVKHRAVPRGSCHGQRLRVHLYLLSLMDLPGAACCFRSQEGLESTVAAMEDHGGATIECQRSTAQLMDAPVC